LKGKTIILVTHQVDFVKNCENIIVMEGGRVLGSGTLDELKRNGVHPEKIFGDHKHIDEENSKANISLAHHHDESIDEPEDRAVSSSDLVDQKIVTPTRNEEEQQVDWNNEIEDQGIIAKDRMKGRVTLKTYWNLLKEAGGIPVLLIILFVNLISQMTTIAYGRMLGAWMDGTFEEWKSVLILGLIVLMSVLSFNGVFLTLALASLKASKRYHKKILSKVINAKVLFFDTQSVGEIINKFSKDIGTIDRFIPVGSVDVMYVLAFLITVLITCGVVYPV